MTRARSSISPSQPGLRGTGQVHLIARAHAVSNVRVRIGQSSVPGLRPGPGGPQVARGWGAAPGGLGGLPPGFCSRPSETRAAASAGARPARRPGPRAAHRTEQKARPRLGDVPPARGTSPQPRACRRRCPSSLRRDGRRGRRMRRNGSGSAGGRGGTKGPAAAPTPPLTKLPARGSRRPRCGASIPAGPGLRAGAAAPHVRRGPEGFPTAAPPPRHLGPPSRPPARRSPPGPRHKAGRSRRRRPPPRTDLEPPRAPLRFWSPPSTRCSPAGRGEAPPTCSFPPAAASRRQGGKRRRSRCPEEEEEEEKQPHQGPARSAPPSMLPRAAPPAFSARRIVAPPRLRGPRCPRRPGRREERWEGPTPCRARLFHFIFFLLLFSAPLPPVGAAGLCRPLLNPSRSPAPRRAARHHSAPCRPLPAPPAEDRAPHPAASSPPSSAPCGSTARHPPRGSPPSRQVLRAYLPGGGGGGGSCLAARRRRVPSAAAKWPPRRHCPPLQPGRGRGGRDGSRGPAGPTACPPVAGEALFKINKRNSNRRPTENERIYCFCSQN